jgi:molybdopterin molybdotransferase
MSGLISVDEALERILAAVPPPTSEVVSLERAAGRVLAAPVKAAHTQPPFDGSAMDGYAVRAQDVRPGRALRLIGTSQAGQRFAGMVGEGQCVRIFTGAPMPIGTDAVIMQEEATVDGNAITFAHAVPPGINVRLAGYDFRRGEDLLPTGLLLTPFALTLIASANQPRVTVTKRPRIAMLATGDELVNPGSQLGPDQIVASNSWGLSAFLSPYCETFTDLGIAPDDPAAIDAALLRALDAGADFVLTTGGASVGDRDFTQEVLLNLGSTLEFWKVAMRPGKPLMFGKRGDTLLFGLPGNPTSALVTANIFVKPAIRRWLGADNVTGTHLHLPLAAPTPPNSARRHFMRGTIETPAGGASSVRPVSQTDSGHVSSLWAADALIVQPEDDPGQPAGTLVEVIQINGF